MLRKSSAKVASAGVTHTRQAVEDGLGWLFREQPTEDYGIDAHVEIVEHDDVRGRLLALQIKSGASWFRQATADGWWFRPDATHVEYWTNHSLPVVVVLYHPETKLCHWQLVNRKTLQEVSTGGWKLLVPKGQVLNGSAVGPLREAAEGDPYVLRLRELQLARPWMKRLAERQRLVIDIEEWGNKTSGRGTLLLGIGNEDGSGPEELASWNIMLGLASYAEVVPKLFEWADASVHEETYDEAEYDLYQTECAIWDGGDTFYTENFSGWRQGHFREELRPYTDDGEIWYWRLELTLNELGKAFLLVDKFATTGGRQLSIM